jgi:hypothetical protein
VRDSRRAGALLHRVRICHGVEASGDGRRSACGGAPKVEKKVERLRRTAVVVVHLGMELEQQESSAQPFAGYVGPLVTVDLEPRGERTGAHMEELAETRVKSETRTVTTATTTAVDDRRQRVRAKVNYFACVRSEAFGKDVVTCIDMSRGGLGFRTKNAYAISTDVTVAVPFSPESPDAPAIYVAARVVNVAELPEMKMFRCGVAFLPVAGTRAHSL